MSGPGVIPTPGPYGAGVIPEQFVDASAVDVFPRAAHVVPASLLRSLHASRTPGTRGLDLRVSMSAHDTHDHVAVLVSLPPNADGQAAADVAVLVRPAKAPIDRAVLQRLLLPLRVWNALPGDAASVDDLCEEYGVTTEGARVALRFTADTDAPPEVTEWIAARAGLWTDPNFEPRIPFREAARQATRKGENALEGYKRVEEQYTKDIATLDARLATAKATPNLTADGDDLGIIVR